MKPTSYKLAVGGALPRPKHAMALSIKYAFKAPVAMTLAPYWAFLMQHFKLLHVVRDGRDIAFSANQGPVEKFYADMYQGTNKVISFNEPLQVKAIRLWSDWNAELTKWAKNMAISEEKKVSGKSFGYFALHAEDLVSESMAVKFSAISHLAEWVGSNLSDQDLCCLAMQDAEFMGSHDRSSKKEVGNADTALSRRYGKWKAKVVYDLQ